ncbi:Ole16p [Asimina triloba]
MAALPHNVHQIVQFLLAAITGAVLLSLSGLTLTGTFITLLVATPLLVLCSPIIVPAAIVISIATAGFIFSGVSAVAGASVEALLNHRAAAPGKHLPRSQQLLDDDIVRAVENKAATGEA